MSKILELQKANNALDKLRAEAINEFRNLTVREKVNYYFTMNLTFLGERSDGGFLYRSFPGGGWGHVLADNFSWERHEVIKTEELLEVFFERYYNDESSAEDTEEKALKDIEESDTDLCKLLRAVLDENIHSFKFDW